MPTPGRCAPTLSSFVVDRHKRSNTFTKRSGSTRIRRAGTTGCLGKRNTPFATTRPRSDPETYRATSRRLLAASLARLGRLDEARTEAQLFLMNNPNFTIGQWAASQPFRDETMRQHFVEGYRLLDLPE